MNHLGDLTGKLRERMHAQSQEVEQVVGSALKDLSGNLLKYAENELNSITADMDAHIQNLRMKQAGISASYWKQNMLANLMSALFLVIMSVCITAYFGWRIQSQNEKLIQLTSRVDNLKKQEAALKDWGITMHQNGQQKYLVFPKGLKLEIAQTNNGLPAVLLKR
ncbi:hypothetical protein [Maridesulfovibrio sp. FT414]|uniref:hypothetical protein n=1 Tax=Maridesulfovibrio sp. FT414 TaxID=2979469 RepID=UPI003D803234